MRSAAVPTLILAAAAALAACTVVDPTPGATVDFLIQPYACSSRIPVEFTIDGKIVGVDTFLVDITPVDHVRSREFTVSPGQHTVHARTGFGYVYPDHTLMLASAQAATDTLPFYCS
jgi:hypothetical protein